MAAVTNPVFQLRPLLDPLEYLPCSNIVSYKRGQTIFGPDQPCTRLYLIVEGRVKVGHLAESGGQSVVDIYTTDEFFGESALVELAQVGHLAIAHENTKVMSWTIAEIEEIATRRPKLAISLMQLLVHRCSDFGARIESLSIDKISRRLARCLIRFSERFGTPTESGPVELIPLTHEFLAQYVGTSREIVTHWMNQFRRRGYLTYNRKNIRLERDALREWLRLEALEA